MGAGATLHSPGEGAFPPDHYGPGGPRQYFCHGCSRRMSYNGSEANSSLLCPYCGSGFIEEMPEIQQRDEERESLARRRQGLQDLSNEQSRRLNNASLMLRLLEYQLHSEIQSMHDTVRQQLQNTSSANTNCMSPVMKKKLRRSVMDTDQVCSQPCCPICSEDFEVNSEQLVLPCSHFYHEACVVPWLDSKKTCPICRYELTNDVPTVEDLEKFSLTELKVRYDTEVKEDVEVNYQSRLHLGHRNPTTT